MALIPALIPVCQKALALNKRDVAAGSLKTELDKVVKGARIQHRHAQRVEMIYELMVATDQVFAVVICPYLGVGDDGDTSDLLCRAGAIADILIGTIVVAPRHIARDTSTHL